MATQSNSRTRRIECVRVPSPSADFYSVQTMLPVKPLAVIVTRGVFLMLELDVTDEFERSAGKLPPVAFQVTVRRVTHGDTFTIAPDFEFLNVADGCAFYAKTMQVQP